MNIPVKVKSIQIVSDSNAAEAVIEFNSREFNANLFPKGLHSDNFDLEILGIDIENLAKAGFIFDFSELQEEYTNALM